MNLIKKLFGIIWMIAGPLAIIYLVKTALVEIEKKPSADTIVQWSVFVLVFIPIGIGLFIFGYFAWKEEYNRMNS